MDSPPRAQVFCSERSTVTDVLLWEGCRGGRFCWDRPAEFRLFLRGRSRCACGPKVQKGKRAGQGRRLTHGMAGIHGFIPVPQSNPVTGILPSSQMPEVFPECDMVPRRLGCRSLVERVAGTFSGPVRASGWVSFRMELARMNLHLCHA